MVGKDCLQSEEDNYTIYTVYNKQPSENDFENCVLCKAELPNSIPSSLNGHFSVSALYQTILRDEKKQPMQLMKGRVLTGKLVAALQTKKYIQKILKQLKEMA